jgi:hypothetical protein
VLDPLTAKERLGVGNSYTPGDRSAETLRDYINLKFAAGGLQIIGDERDFPFLQTGRSLLANFRERVRLLSDYLCPADQRIDAFLRSYLADCPEPLSDLPALVPNGALVLERHGLARLLSIPPDRDRFDSEIISSYRVAQGVCHNPAKDRRTTEGVFHVAEGGLPIPFDKKSVPKVTFAHLLAAALRPPDSLASIPYTTTQEQPTRAFLSVLLRPTVSPEVPGIERGRSMEVRFFAPGILASNLDFVESIFGNAGDPFLPENDAALDVEGWTGHTGCAILAPHLTTLTKRELGLPHLSEATKRQVRDGMCWEDEEELYNEGGAFKITCRDRSGVIVTLIADNYFGYCKKEVKSQISYACNLLGGCEEEHAGGAIAFPSYDHGEDFALNKRIVPEEYTFSQALSTLGERAILQPTGYAVDKAYANITYLPEDATIDQDAQRIRWEQDGTAQGLKLRSETTYVYPSGYKVELTRPAAGRRWRLVGTQAEGTFCHKPCTVSGGGKSEISKPLTDAMTAGSIIIPDFAETMRQVREILYRNYWDRYPHPRKTAETSRSVLDHSRSLGSVLKLLTVSPEFADAHNEFLGTLSKPAIGLALLIKRLYKPDWGDWDDWCGRFTEDVIDGQAGYELKYLNEKVITRYLRVGYEADGTWRTFSLRKDFLPATKLQREDDISVSVTLPTRAADGLHPELPDGPYKFIANCEYRYFQRPDDAIHRGYDKGAEHDFSKCGNFFSNYEPLDREALATLTDDAINFEEFSEPLRNTLLAAKLAGTPDYVVTTAHPRLVNGVPSKNPRYLQDRNDLHDRRAEYLADIGIRLYRRVTNDRPVATPVNAVLPGRRNNPPDPAAGIRALAVYNPIHYQELPEVFMDFISSLTGKSPSTTGAGSEGALTKGPFNPLSPIVDLNNALVSAMLTRQPHFISAAGYVGPRFRVDHDISLIVPEVWSRMRIAERDPAILIAEGMLEPCSAIAGIEESGRLGYRITERFVTRYFGRVFADAGALFSEEMLRPELQDLDSFVDGMSNILETQRRVAQNYFEDGSIADACPPLNALLHIMAQGEFNGLTLESPEVRVLFDPDTLLTSEWYLARLEAKAKIDARTWGRHLKSLEEFAANEIYSGEQERHRIPERQAQARQQLDAAQNPAYLDRLKGTLGADPAVI